MRDLNYIISLGFSGADVFPAIMIAFVMAMFVRKEAPVWKMALIALAADRVLWPIIGQALAGAELHTIYASIGALIKSFPSDAGVYVVRFFGLLVMIALFVAVRRRIHKMAPAKKSGHAHA